MKFLASHRIAQTGSCFASAVCGLLLAIEVVQAQAGHPLANWKSNVDAAQGRQLFESAYGAGKWVAVGNVIIRSTNAVQWTADLLPNQTLYTVFWDGTAFIAGGKSSLSNQLSLLYVSANGSDWGIPPIVYGDTNGIYAGTVGGSTKLVVGENGLVIRNTGGGGWQRNRAGEGSQPVGNLYGVAYGLVRFPDNLQNRFIAVGQEGRIWASGAGGPRAWIEVTPDRLEGRDLFNVTYAQGRFVAVGDRVILYSFDGLQWQRSPTPVGVVLYGVTYHSRYFVAVGQQGTVLYSLDGIEWTKTSTGLTSALSGICYSGRTFIATSISDENLLTGSGGAIIQSAPIAGFDYPPPQNNKRQVRFMTELGMVYRVEATTDFLQWSTVEQFVGPGGCRVVTDTSLPEPQRRFYRIVLP